MTSVPNPSLEAGQAALQRGDYEEAIAQFEGICEVELDPTLIARAQQALVVAYCKGDRATEAIALCHGLVQTPEDYPWAVKTLEDLLKRYPEANTLGLVPVKEKPPSRRRRRQPSQTSPDLPSTPQAGIEQSLVPASDSAVGEASPTVFVPGRLWRNAERATKWKRMKKPKLRSGTVLQWAILGAVPLFFALRFAIAWAMATINWILLWLPFLEPLSFLQGNPPDWLVGVLVALFFALPGIMDGLQWKLWCLQITSAIALFTVANFSVEWAMTAINDLLNWLPLLQPLQLFYRDPEYGLMTLGVLLFATSPWVLDGVLKYGYGMERFSVPKLAAQYPESAKVLQKMTRQKKMPIPQLGLLPTNAPISMTYGNRPKTARIVVSQGLLEQLEDEELAVLYATQVAQIINGDFAFLSGAIACLQIPFILYWQISHWGERGCDDLKTRECPRRIPAPIWNAFPVMLRWTSAILASCCYGFYWLWRVTLLWVSRQRLYYSDRLAAEYMGNPNALSRALLKTAMGTAAVLKQQQRTNWLLEGFDLLLPIGHRQALSLGSIPDKTPFSEVLTWECTNPYRQWLALTNSHPLIGDRLYLLNRYANFWQLPPEIDLPTLIPPARTLKQRLAKLKNSYQALPILQSAVLSGLIFGILFRSLFWLAGFLNEFVISRWVSGSGIIWLYNANNDAIVSACILAAFSLSIIVWINGYFPDIRILPTRNEPRLQDLISNPKAVPPKSPGVRMTGKLIGRKGLSNWLMQDLILETSTGSIKLHFFTKLGPFGNLFWHLQQPLFWLCRGLSLRKLGAFVQKYTPLYPRPDKFIGREVTVIGWFRRGSTPWIDVDTIRTPDKNMVQSGYPVWVTGLAVVAAIRSAYLFWLS